MRLSTHEAARRTLAGLIRKLAAQDVTSDGDIAKFRATVYGLTGLLAYFKHGADLEAVGDLAARVDALESGRAVADLARRIDALEHGTVADLEGDL